MGVAGGELLIPTIVLLYGVDIKIAGSLSLVVSLPTMLVAFARYSRDNSFQALRDNKPFVVVMTIGSIGGTLLGGLLLGIVPTLVLIRCWCCSCCCPRSRSGDTPKQAILGSTRMVSRHVDRGPYMMTATPIRQTTAPMMSHRSGRNLSTTIPQASDPATKTRHRPPGSARNWRPVAKWRRTRTPRARRRQRR